MLAIMGASGAGKTTLLNLLAGRLPADGGAVCTAGSVRVNGHPRVVATFKRQAAYVVQEAPLFGQLSAREALTFSARLRLPRGLGAAAIDARVDGVLAELGLPPAVAATRVGGGWSAASAGGSAAAWRLGPSW
ncbi:hypothetical protein BU14_0324s0019 [Porphyra umbilicalis]|uniref:ABC transporter domain-containing protein n=1 Tax=Porphyra umbilicalis TaxID=2786 RepID=A0A1X6NZ94_PORUM|nr:hypothetical protein BU14_0324s0019 [Porphyra umbilicalis]|eukprot:OSX73855.1 hypothetical protein BU14_0324s0019 [Porphyra umbilicalis]